MKKLLVLVAIFILGYSAHVVQVYTIDQMNRACGLYGWNFLGFYPEPLCRMNNNTFPLRRLRAMYPNATPFPELPSPNNNKDG